jgi:hypothetical protein
MTAKLPMYEGDGYIRDGLADLSAGAYTKAGPRAYGGPDSSRLTIGELAYLEREARRMRSRALGDLIERLFARLDTLRARWAQRALERRLGTPTDAVDLEQRLRALERREPRFG